MLTEEYLNMCQRTLDNLREAQRHLQATLRCVGVAIHFNTLNGTDRKLLNKIKVDLVGPIEQIECVIDAKKIELR